MKHYTIIPTLLLALLCACQPKNEPDAPNAYSNNANNQTTGSGSILTDPVAIFSYSVSQPRKVTLINKSVDADYYKWDFGDGETSTDAAPVHIYAKQGAYRIKLTASTKQGKSNETYADVTVKDPTACYVSGYEYTKIPWEDVYYIVRFFDEDLIINDYWYISGWQLLSNNVLPKAYTATNPGQVKDWQDANDTYYIQVAYSMKGTGDGTQVLKQPVTTKELQKCPEQITVSSNNKDTEITIYFSYK